MKDFGEKISKMIGADDVASKGSQPAPVHLWNPELSGDIDIIVKRDGSWWHEGDEIKRPEIVKTFSNILKLEGNEYYLITPVEKWRIQVEDAPFIVIAMDEVDTDEGKGIKLTTKTGESFVLNNENPLEVEYKTGLDGEPSPYALVRTNLRALISRSVFYDMAEQASIEQEADKDYMVIYSQGHRFVLGAC
jgi:hypothetical protein